MGRVRAGSGRQLARASVSAFPHEVGRPWMSQGNPPGSVLLCESWTLPGALGTKTHRCSNHLALCPGHT